MRPRTALTSILLAGTVAASLAIAPTVASASPPQAPPPAAASVVPAAPTADGERVVLSEDFSGGMPSGWRPVEGTWAVVDGRLRGTGKGGMLSRITFGPHLEAYRLEATVRFDSVENTSRWAALGLDLAADGSVPWWIATMRSNTVAPNGLEFAERTASNAWNVTDTAAAPTAAGTGRDVKVRVEVRGSRAAWFFDGTKVMETRHLVRSTDGGLGLLLSGAVVSFDDVTVTEIPNTADSLLRQPGEDMAVIAHRGYSQVAPEDTMASYESAARAGADFLENDVQSTADGVPMILHDDTLDRTTDHTGRLDAAQSADVRTLDAGSWFSRYFTGQRVPTSVEMLQHAKAKGRQVLLEIKGPETRPEIERIVREVGETAMKESTVIQSFDPEILRTVHAIDPTLRLGLLRSTLDADPVAAARSAFASTYNPAWAALAGHPDAVAALHGAGIAVQPWTVDDPRQWDAMDRMGVDGVITNRAGGLIGWQAARVAPAKPTVAFVGPAAGAELTRGDHLVPAVDESGADTVDLTLDGTAVREGAAVDVDTLALGEHVLVARATGPGGTATDTVTVTVTATREGLLHLVTDRRVPTSTALPLVQHVLKGDWAKVARLAATSALPSDLRALVVGDAEALARG
ncbi:glycerophosphodiester phosphodiesterase family protein [Terrabacter sp. LjRoot27]|uniref:glycerophosphodiester phosphodiesterase n=1 Tax=Terrabacter sp. LjRoot27 TaxID=3342306 RepID=UPI003ED03075